MAYKGKSQKVLNLHYLHGSVAVYILYINQISKYKLI